MPVLVCPDSQDAQRRGIGGQAVSTQVMCMAQRTRARWWPEAEQAVLRGQWGPQDVQDTLP